MDSVILKAVLSSQGSVDREELECNLGDASFIAQIIDSNAQLVACSFSGTAKVVARSRVRLCRARECPGCGGLHLCKNFLFSGACHLLQSRRRCSFNHDLHSEYNMEVLREFGLESLNRTELCLLLLQSNNTLLPQICHDYNNTCGCWVECPRLHVCERHLSGKPCSCTRAHDFSATQPLRLLREKHIPDDLFKVLKSVYANKEALRLADKGKGVNNSETRASSDANCEWEWELSDSNQDAIGDALLDWAACDSDSSSTISTKQNQSSHHDGGQKKTRGRKGRRRTRQKNKTPSGVTAVENCEGCVSDSSSTLSTGQSKDRRGFGSGSAEDVICMFFIRGYCQHEDSCLNLHDTMPYRWQIKQGAFWNSMAENETLEKDYCDPQKTYSATCPSVCFETMKSGQNRVRRLSTVNSVVKPNYSHTTDWLWYWEDDNGQWHQYAQSKHRLIRITSKKLEEMYLKNSKDVMMFTAGSQLHELSFQDMIEKNLTDSSKRHVRRRPRFVSAAEVQNKRNPSANITVLPFCLDKTQVAQKGPNASLAPVAMSNVLLTLGQLQLIPKTSRTLCETKSDPFSTLLLAGSQLTTTTTTTNALLKYSTAPEANLATCPQITFATTSEKSQFRPPQKTTTKVVTSTQQATNAQFTLPVTSTSSTATNSVNTFSTTSISQMTPPTTKSQLTFTTQAASANFKSTTPAAATKSTSQFTSASTTGTTLTNECSYTTSTCGLKSPEQVLTNKSQSKSPMTTSTSATQSQMVFDISHTSVAFGFASPEAATKRTTETSTSSKCTFPTTTNRSNAFSTFSVTTASSNPFSPSSSVDRSQMTPTPSATAQSQFTSSTLQSSTNSPSAYSKLSTTTLTTKSQLTHTTAAPTLPTSNFTSSTLTTSGLKSTNPFSIDLTPSKSQPVISQAAKSQFSSQIKFSTASETNSPNAFSTSSIKSQPSTTFAATSSNPFSPTLSADRLQKITPETTQPQFTSPTLKTSGLKPSNQFSKDLTTLKFEATTATSRHSPNAVSISSSTKPQLKSKTASAFATTSQLASPTRSLTTTAASSTQPQSMAHFTNSTTSRRSHTSSTTWPGFELPTHAATSSALAGNSPKAFSPTAADSTFPTASAFDRNALPVTRSATSRVTTHSTATKNKDSCIIL